MGLGMGPDGNGKSRPHRSTNPGPSSPFWVAVLTVLSRSPSIIQRSISYRIFTVLFRFRKVC